MELKSQFIQRQNGANYFVCLEPSNYKPKKEVLFFGNTEIKPGIRITKIGEKKRTSFEMQEGSFLQYDGTVKLGETKHCLFSSTWEDSEFDFIYRYAFAMADTNKPTFLYVQNGKGNGGYDVDCRVVQLIKD